MHRIAFLLLLLCVHVARVDNFTDCNGRRCKFGKCVGKRCECDPGFTRRRSWPLFYQEHYGWRKYHYDVSCQLPMDTHVPGACSRNVKCAIGASCKNDMCTCDEPGWSVGPEGTMYQNMCTAGTMKDCQLTTTATSSSKCLRPVFVTCENTTNSHSCNCEMPNKPDEKPESSGGYDSQCQLKIHGILASIPPEPTNEYRFFFNIPGNKPCADELLPAYTCGCQEGKKNCEHIVGAKCSGAPDPDCYVPPGIFCNTTSGQCDCDRNQGYIWVQWTQWDGKCIGIPGAKCIETEDCVQGSNCEAGKCSPCPGTHALELATGKCALSLMDPCEYGNDDCPDGTRCRYENELGLSGRKLCNCASGWHEYDPVLHKCVANWGGECSDSHTCKNGDGTVCEYDKRNNRHICVCDKKMGFTYYDGFNFGRQCRVMNNHTCKPGGIKCFQEDFGPKWDCLKSKDHGDQYTCVLVPEPTTPTRTRKEKDFGDNGEEDIIGSIAVIGFGLTTAVISAVNY